MDCKSNLQSREWMLLCFHLPFSSLLNLWCHSSSSPQPLPPGRCRKQTRSSKAWREPSTWGGSWSSSTTGESWRTSCSSSWPWPSSSPLFSTFLRNVSSPSFSQLAGQSPARSHLDFRKMCSRYFTLQQWDWTAACSEKIWCWPAYGGILQVKWKDPSD